MKAISDSTRNQNGNFGLAYHHTISRVNDHLVVVSVEFKRKFVSLYDLDFNLLDRFEIIDATNEIHAVMNDDKLVYIKRWPKTTGDVYVHTVDLGLNTMK